MKLKNPPQLAVVVCMFFFIASCRNKDYKFPKAPEQVFLTEENMPPVEYFTLEKVEIPEDAQTSRWFYLHADTLLFTVQNKAPNPFLLSVYNLMTNELVAGYFIKGRGPGELVSVHCIFRNDEIFVNDVTQKVAVLNIDSIARLLYEYKPTIISTDWYTEYTRYVNDTLIGINDFHFYGFGYEQLPEFVKVSCLNGEIPKECFPEKMKGTGPMNINMRISYFNEYTKQYVVAWRSFPYLSVYDENFNLQKQYIGPDNYMPNLVEYNDDGVFFNIDSVRTRFYLDGCQTENYIFFINDRICGENYSSKPKNAEIYCFDKSLNLVRRLKQKDLQTKYLLLPSYCEKTGNLYFQVFDEDSGGYLLYKCVFEK